ncbi:MAG: hypothetical protein C0448_07830 [Sphingobacteriaceae bacterium]|nr:hypothetical protein [Sphingobacteriaceae bacterium]
MAGHQTKKTFRLTMTFHDITKHFGTKLADLDFQKFLKSISCDPTTYNVAESDYIISADNAIEIGFNNKDAEYDEDEKTIFKKGTPIFSFFNLHPKSYTLVSSIPFNLNYNDTRKTVREKVGLPIKMVEFEDKFFNKRFIVDHYRIDNLAIAIDYNSNDEKIASIQISDYTQLKEHLKF